MKVKEPVAPEYHRLAAHKNQVLFTYLHLAASRECTDALVAANNVAIAYETCGCVTIRCTAHAHE